MNFKIHTFGCKVNSYESEYMAELFEKSGYTVSGSDDADIHIINSCTVTSVSDKKVRKLITRLRREQPGSVIVLTGCIPQSRILSGGIDLLDADIICGTKNRSETVGLVNEYLKNSRKIICVRDYGTERDFESMKCENFSGRTRASIKIEDGCDNFCSYCIIPFARGRVRSRTLEDISVQANRFAELGFKEIVLTGINLSAYGTDIGVSLYEAAKVCCEPQSIKRVRLGSLETEEFSFDMLEKLSGLEKLCPHFHLSLQSGSDNILRLMNRKYDSAQYIALTDKMKELFENCAVTTDIIVGFPGETDEDFEKTLKMIDRVGFSDAHIFPYSKREGTRAAAMPQLPDYIKAERAKIAQEYAHRSKLKYLDSQIGRRIEVLFEHESSPHYHNGHAPNYCQVKINAKNGEKSLQNSCFYVKINEYDDFGLKGEIEDENYNQ